MQQRATTSAPVVAAVTVARNIAKVVNPLGWLLLAGGLLGLTAAAFTSWRELTLVAVACLLLLAITVPFLGGRTRVRVTLVLEPSRVVAGGSVAAGVDVVNISGRRMLPTVLDLPVGAAVHRYGVPALPVGGTHEETFTVRTDRRGVIPVGPVVTRRGDPLGVFSRDTEWTGRHEILVRPALVPLDALGAGLLRDLEGITTEAISQSDLAFHALREYVPGDDLRHVHWRSSAKATGASGESQLLVRQYVDTRRSHATVVVDDQLASWGGDGSADEAFETAMSVTASIIIRAVTDDFEASYVCGDHASSGFDGNVALDAVCRTVTGTRGLMTSAREASRLAPDTSLLFLLAGGDADFESVLRASTVFGPEVRRVAILVDHGGRAGVSEAAGLTVLRLSTKEDLPGLLRWSVR